MNTKFALPNEAAEAASSKAAAPSVIQQFYSAPSAQFYFYSKFTERIRVNLHIVLAFSPFGEQFRKRIRAYPSIVNCSTIDYFKVSLFIINIQSDAKIAILSLLHLVRIMSVVCVCVCIGVARRCTRTRSKQVLDDVVISDTKRVQTVYMCNYFHQHVVVMSEK